MNGFLHRSFLLITLLLPSSIAIGQPLDPAGLRTRALNDDIAYRIVEGLTTEIGPRPAGSMAEAAARNWAVRELTALGFSNVRIETFPVPTWTRGIETAEIQGPVPRRLVLTALGNSAATPPGGLTAEVIGFDGIEALRAASDDAVRGRIVFVQHHMAPTQDISAYAGNVPLRSSVPNLASKKGAVAAVIRSIGTDFHRNPHTGLMIWDEGVKAIPIAALSLPDSDQLGRILAREMVKMKLVLTPTFGRGQSGNVIAEIPGSDPEAGIVAVGGHLDSWDLGTGAVDDGAGLAIVTAAARQVAAMGQPKRTIRVVWFGDEETGGRGDQDYAARHGSDDHVLVAEADSGTGRIWRMDADVAAGSYKYLDPILQAIAPLGILPGAKDRAYTSDFNGLIKHRSTAVIQMTQDMTQYFDIHHTPDDTLDKISLPDLRQNVAAWAVMLGVVANDPNRPMPSK